MTGGHNIDPTIEKFVLDNTVSRNKIKVDFLDGKRVLKINPADINVVNPQFLGGLRYVDNHLTSTASVKKIEKVFNNSRTNEIRNIETVFAVSADGQRGYQPQQQIGWAFEENLVPGNILSIKKADDGFYVVNNKKTATCYNIREAVEEHLQRQPGAECVVELENFSETEAKYLSENIASRFTGKNNKSSWRYFLGTKERISSVDYDFTRKEVKQLENGTIQIVVPKKNNTNSVFLRIMGVAKSLYKTATARIDKVFKAAASNPSHDIPTKLMEEFRAAGIPIEKIIISADDCVICIIKNHRDDTGS